MDMSVVAINRLAQQFNELDIPYESIDFDGSNIKYILKPEATPQNHVDAQNLIKNIDLAPKKRRKLARIKAEIESLTAAQKTALFTHIAAFLVREFPDMVPGLKGDEPV